MQIVSLHSQKGGTGKTSIALSLAIEAQRRNLTPLFVDADLSGTSVRDSIHLKPVTADQSIKEFFLAAELTDPIKYIATAELLDLEHNLPKELSILLGDTQTGLSLMSLVYKETHSQFLRTRIEMLINALDKAGQIDVIIFDNSPGEWGLGKAILEIIAAGELRDNSAVELNGKAILVSSLDLNDIVSCLHLKNENSKKIPYLHILNRSGFGTDVEANVSRIADNLDQKATLTGQDGYATHAAKLRSDKVEWIGAEDSNLAGTYQAHVKGIHVPANISELANKLGWKPVSA